MRYIVSTLALVAMVACGNAADQSTADEAAPVAAPAAVVDSPPMPGHVMPNQAMGSGALMAQMRQHMTMMQANHPDTGQAAMVMYRMGAQMLAQMEMDVSAMKLPADPRWSALLDSVRQDMATMPGMRGGMMPGQGRGMMSEQMTAHRDRVMRLMDLHQSRMPQQTTSR
jgi:hypothetical protein